MQSKFNNVRTNRFGDPEQLISAEGVVSKQGELLPIYKGYVELGGSLYKLEISSAKQESKRGRPRKWVKVTKLSKRKQHATM